MEMPAARALGVSNGQSHSAGEGERATFGPQTQVWSIPCLQRLCHKNPRGPIVFEDNVLGRNHQTRRIKTHPFIMVYKILFGLTLPFLFLALSPTTVCLTSFVLDILDRLRPLYLPCCWLPQGLCICCSYHPECSSLLPSPICHLSAQ